jgi:hypothetical protein
MAGHFLFPNPPTQDRLTLWLLGMRDKQSTQGSMQVQTVQTGDVPAIPEQTQIHAFSVQRMHEGFSAGGQTSSPSGSPRVEWRRRNLSHGSPWPFIRMRQG